MAISTVVAVLVAALAVYAYLNTGPASAASPDSMTYAPTSNTKYCNDIGSFGANHVTITLRPPASDLVPEGTCANDTVANRATSNAADTTNIQKTPTGDVNFASVVTLDPADETVASSGSALGLPPLPLGALVGGLASKPNLSIANQPCNNSPEVDFILYNVALPNGTVTLTGGAGHGGTATNIAYPRVSQASEGNRFNGWSTSGPPAANTGGTSPLTSPGGTGALFALHDSIAITNYPSYLLTVFADTSGNPVIPVALYGGATAVLGQTVPLYFAVFKPGDLTTMAKPMGLIHDMGIPTVAVLNDPSDRAAFPGSLTNFCTSLDISTMLLGNARTYPSLATQVRRQNPSTVETGYQVQYNLSQRDTDQDGIENALDTCPTIVNAGNPRIAGSGDVDNDGIDQNCDPTPTVDTGSGDADGDGFSNSGDNCPLANNPTQHESELPASIGAQGNNADNGPETDSIGDACDSEAGTITPMQNGVAQSILMSDTIPNGRFMIATLVQAKCFGGTDADLDGYCVEDADTSGTDSGACAASCIVRHDAWSGPQMVMDSDSDNFTDAQETYMGTDPTKSCAQTPVAPSVDTDSSPGAGDGALSGDEPVANWPFDFNDDRLAGLGDVTFYAAVFGNPVVLPPNANPTTRWDLDQDGFIGLGDVTMFAAVFNKRCGQGNVAPGPYPGMPGPYVQQ